MPVYYFHIRSERGVHPDTEGVRLADGEAVRREAIDRALVEMSEGAKHDEDRMRWMFDVRDDADRPVLSFPFADAIPAG
ncbi:DUF6894 family protein [Salinarimonas ramus]|uniref:DUF6894 domain-containing protein n=1 Tax=Salinarimonas ramus TaxID=690164 RepID=A0A917QBZ5_9HYPH|nr:hypothetical protein [Salinarimonas ramus]GGK42193.1 hypothetical protein GCM10011322_31700 [Salinarimonas ramus]